MANRVQIKRGEGAPSFNDLSAYELGYDTTDKVLYIHGTDGIEVVNASVIQKFIDDSSDNGRNHVNGFVSEKWIINENATVESNNLLVHQGATGNEIFDKSYVGIVFDKGGFYTLSGFVKGTPNLTIELISLSTGESHIWQYNVVGENYEYITETFEIPAAGEYNFALGGDGTNTDGLYFQSLQIESGKVATDWRPAPEDVNDLLERIKRGELELDDIELVISNIEVGLTADIEGIQGRVSQTEQTIVQVSDDLGKAINDIEVGGRNLLKDSSKSVSFTGTPTWQDFGDITWEGLV